MSQLQTAETTTTACPSTVHRVEVRPRPPVVDERAADAPGANDSDGAAFPQSNDPRGEAVLRDVRSLGLTDPPARIDCTLVYLIEGELNEDEFKRIATELLADPVTEVAAIGAAPQRYDSLIEVHPLPGVMDPDAEAIELAIEAMLGRPVRVQTGRRYDIAAAPQVARIIALRVLANPVIHAVHESPFQPEAFPQGHEHPMEVRSVPLRDLDDAALEMLSRESHLFLSLEEMKAIQQEYRALGREPREIELETLAQTWSEHCVHKTLKARIRYREGTKAGSAGVPPADECSAGGDPAAASGGARATDTAGGAATHPSAPKVGSAGVSPADECSAGGDPAAASGGARATDTAGDAATHPPAPSLEGKGRFAINFANRPGQTINPDGSVTIDNLLKSTVVAATHELIADGIDWCLSVFHDNSGVIAFDDDTAVCFKVETHNHPSAIEPYGGAATGIGGCIRDIIGTGLAAKPIAATDVFCVAHPSHFGLTTEHTESTEEGSGFGNGGLNNSENCNDESGNRDRSESENQTPLSVPSVSSVVTLPSGCLHPRRILKQVVAGVRDYGNRMGIPTLNGAVWFDNDYVGNPLVYCGCVGVMPRDKVHGEARSGDHIIAVGGRTGRDGIHGATFSSAELTETHVDEFAHAVQIGNAVTEKKVLDAILAARDYAPRSMVYAPPPSQRGEAGRGVYGDGSHASNAHSASTPAYPPGPVPGREGECLFNAITDCGAGGFSSAVGEMGEKLGATVHLERAPLKYAGLTPTEIWISEAQERMVLAVPEQNLAALRTICDLHDVEMCDLGTFGTPDRDLILLHGDVEYGRLPMEFLHEGIPATVREAEWEQLSVVRVSDPPVNAARSTAPPVGETLFALLAHPNIASKHWIIRQYDHEVQGGTVLKPLVGERGEGPGDAAVIRPVETSTRGLAIGNGLATGLKDDPYLMALAAIDECVRNLVCVGADPERIAILDNFCWPSCAEPRNLGSLVRAAEGCYDGAKAYRTPFISGKDSLNNQFRTEDGKLIEIPPTLLISGFGIVPDVRQCVTMDAKRAGNLLVIVGETSSATGGSHYDMIRGGEGELPVVDLEAGPKQARAVHSLISQGLVQSAHDCSEGGVLVAAAEMAMAGRLGLHLDLTQLPGGAALDHDVACFSETPSRYLLEVRRDDLDLIDRELADIPHAIIGEFNESTRLTLRQESLKISIDELIETWRGTLDW